MTEDEAKQKWCPMGRTLYQVGSVAAACNWFVNNHGENVATRCIGSGCMMWRANKMPQDYPAYKVTFDGEMMSSQQVDIVDFGGYCGLGGKP